MLSVSVHLSRLRYVEVQWLDYFETIRAFDRYPNQRPWMTLNDHYAFYFKMSFGVHHENLNEDRPHYPHAAKM